MTEPLIAEASPGVLWLPADYLRDGAVVARLRLGDRKGATPAFTLLLPSVRRNPAGTFRARLLSAHIAVGGGHLR